MTIILAALVLYILFVCYDLGVKMKHECELLNSKRNEGQFTEDTIELCKGVWVFEYNYILDIGLHARCSIEIIFCPYCGVKLDDTVKDT